MNIRGGAATMEIKYIEKGKKGETCADCVIFQADKDDPKIGRCFSQQVNAEGSCNYFQAKE